MKPPLPPSLILRQLRGVVGIGITHVTVVCLVTWPLIGMETRLGVTLL